MKKCPKCGKIYPDSYVVCKKDKTPVIEVGQKETVRIMFRRKILKFTIIFITFCIVVAVALKLSVVMENVWFEKGRVFLVKAEETTDGKLFNKSLKGSISSLKTALLLNKANIFNPFLKRAEICYLLGNAYLLSGKNNLAEECFKITETVFPGEEIYSIFPELEVKKLQSLVSVNGIIGGNRAIINGYMVKEGDLVRGIEVVNITDSYVMFNKDGIVFSSSMDKYNPIVKNLKMKYLEDFQTIRQNEKLGIARIKFIEMKTEITRFLKIYMMDVAQQQEMRSLIAKCDEEISLIDLEVNKEKMQGRILEGMSMDDVIFVLGEPLSRNRLFEMDIDEKWVYKDKVLYFKDGEMEDNGLLVSIENAKENEY